MSKRTSPREEQKEAIHFVIDRRSHSSSWGTPRTRAFDLAEQSQSPSSISSRSTQRCSLDSSDDDAYVQIEAPRPPSTVAQPAPDAPPDAPPGHAGVQSSRQSDISASIGGVVALEAKSQHSPSGRMGDYVPYDDPFRAMLAHTNVLWRQDYDSSMIGFRVKGYPIALFDSSSITEGIDHIDSLSDHDRKCYRFDRNQFYIDLFFQMRLFRKKMKKTRPSPTSLTESWNAFIGEYYSSAENWIKRLHAERERFVSHTLIGFKMEVHQRSIAAGFACGVRRDQDCPFCYKDSKKIPDHVRLDGSFRLNIPGKLRMLMLQLDMRCLEDAAEKREQVAEEYDAQHSTISDEFYNQDQHLMMQQQVTTANLEIHRLKRNSMSLDRQVQKLTKRFNESEERHQDERDSLVQLVHQLSKKVKNLSEHKV